MRVKFNKYNILKKNKNKLNIKYSLNKNVDGNCLKKNNSELSLALSQDINYSNSDNLLNNKYSKNNKNIFRKKNSLNENIIKKLIQKVRANIVDIKNNNKEKNLLKNANMNIQINSSINNGKTNKMRIILKNKENYFKKKINENNYKSQKNEGQKNFISNEGEEQEKLFNTNQKYFFKFRKDIIEEPDLEEETD
jgi:hypothetical protein